MVNKKYTNPYTNDHDVRIDTDLTALQRYLTPEPWCECRPVDQGDDQQQTVRSFGLWTTTD
jgi:hypothetical protein